MCACACVWGRNAKCACVHAMHAMRVHKLTHHTHIRTWTANNLLHISHSQTCQCLTPSSAVTALLAATAPSAGELRNYLPTASKTFLYDDHWAFQAGERCARWVGLGAEDG